MDQLTIELTRDRLIALIKAIEVTVYEPTNDKRIRADRCIFSEVRSKLLKKYVDREHKPKPFNLKLKYYEAYALELYLRDWLFEQRLDHTVRLVRLVADDINQKLA